MPPVDLLQNMNKFWDSTCFGLARSRLRPKTRGDFLFVCFKPVSLACCSLSATVGGKQLSPVLSQREGIWTGMFDEQERANTLGCVLYVKAAPAVFLLVALQQTCAAGRRQTTVTVSQPAAQPPCSPIKFK